MNWRRTGRAGSAIDIERRRLGLSFKDKSQRRATQKTFIESYSKKSRRFGKFGALRFVNMGGKSGKVTLR